ncbi:ABC transporter permease [Catenuloplanes japonicus]|uniref:ABC transporter permease n=1 Tax=Catenuloplanes japonicus TaxID=33876 RepID=UPI000523F26D|nr:ABC transporter permease [Catenuloplanes japonicus]
MTPPALALREAARLLRHPLVLAGTVLAIGMSAESARLTEPLYVYQGMTMVQSFCLGPMVIVAAFRAAGRERRAGTAELIAVTPYGARRRVRALLCAAAGPAVLTAVIVGATPILYRYAGAVPLRWPGLAELAVQPVRLLGAGLLGIMAALWLPLRGAPAAALCLAGTVMAVVNAYTHGTLRLTLAALFPFGDLADGWSDPAWHVAYLGCLCALAACGALLATPGPRRRPLLCATAAGAGAAVTGWLQLR